MIVLPLQLLFLADLFNRYWFIQRQFVWVMAWYAFFLGWCWDSIITATVEWVKIKKADIEKTAGNSMSKLALESGSTHKRKNFLLTPLILIRKMRRL